MKKYCNRGSFEDGVALVFALSMLALLLIMLIGFLASSILEQRIAYSYRDDVGSRLLVRSAMVRVLAQLRNETDDLLFIRNGSTAENIMTPLVSMSNVDVPQQRSSEAVAYSNANNNDSNGNPRYAYRALKPLLKKYFGPDTTTGNVENDWEWRNWFPQSGSGAPAMYYPEWIYYYQRTLNGSGNDRLTGRMAYVVVPNLGINLNQFGSGNTRNGVYFDELPINTFLTNTGVTRLNRLDNWLSPDILLGNPGLYSNNSTVDNNRKTANEFFNFAQLDITDAGNTKANFFSGELGGSMSNTSTPGDYREFATVYLTGDDREFSPTAYNETTRQKTGAAVTPFPTETNLSTWQSFVTGNFDISGSQADQAAANIKDYIDADSIPESDVLSTNWLSSTTHPTFTGNEKTPYINQIVPALSLTATYTRTYTETGGGGILGILTRQRTYTLKLSDIKLKGKIFVELINIYPDNLKAKKVILKGLKATFDADTAQARGGSQVATVIPGVGGKTQPITFGDLTCDIAEITVGGTDIMVNANNYAVMESEEVTFSGNITMNDLVLDPYSALLGEPRLDVTIRLKKLEFDRAILYDENDKPVDFVKGMSVSDKDFINRVLLSTADDRAQEMSFNGNNQTKTVSQYASFAVIDPRCNLGNSGEWLEGIVRNRAAELMAAADLKGAGLNFGTANEFEDDVAMKNDKLPEAGNEDEWKDLEPEEDPAKVASGYIRNAPMQSIFELGLIHRGKPWQTFNLRSTKNPGDNPDTPFTDLTGSGGTKAKLSYMNDAAILERYRFGTTNSAPKFNINQPANMTGAFAPLVEGLQYNTLPGQTAHTLDDNAKRDLRLWFANKCYNAGGNNPTAATAKCYNRYTRHSEVVNVITDWAINSDNSPLRADALRDTHIEELVAKIVPLVRFGEMYEYYTVFAVAQTIKDLGGTIRRYDSSGNLTSHSGHIGRWDDGVDMITSETWLVARIRRTINCQVSGTQVPVSCLWGQHNTSCTKNVEVLECYTVNPE